MKKWTIAIAAASLMTLAMTSQEVRVTPGTEDIGSGASSDPDKVWSLGGIDGRWLAVGEPNTLNRRDKVVMRFDIRAQLWRGPVRRAVLRYQQTPFGYRDEVIAVEHYTAERLRLGGNDLVTNQAEMLTEYESDHTRPGRLDVAIDVTDAVNADLRRGFGFTAFRISSRTAEQEGNPQLNGTGVTVDTGTPELILSID